VKLGRPPALLASGTLAHGQECPRSRPGRVLPLFLIQHLLLGLLLLAGGSLRAEVKSFPLAGGNVLLERADVTAGVFFRAFRPNRATGRWDVDLVVTNGSTKPLKLPLVLRFDTAERVAPGILGTVVDADGKLFLDLTAQAGGSELAPGASLPGFTISLGDGQTRPALQAALFSGTELIPPSLALVRTIDFLKNGLPEEGVVATEIGPAIPRSFTSARGGWLTLEASAGVRAWSFRHFESGLAVRTVSELLPGKVMELPSVRPIPREFGTVMILPRDTLPLPAGWSPVHLRGGTAGADAIPASPVGQLTVLARWDESALAWRAVRTIPSDNAEPIPFEFPTAGFLAVLAPDKVPVAPRLPGDGELVGGVMAPVAATSLRAVGRVDPPSRPASRDESQVTAGATLELTSTAGPLTSGLPFTCEITQEYRLRDGSRRRLPSYTLRLTAHRPVEGPADGPLLAGFPLRPFQLLAGEELVEAVIRAEVLAPAAFTGGVLDANGGALADGSLRVTAAAGDFARSEAAVLRRLAVPDVTGLVPEGLELVQAFELSVATLQQGRSLTLQTGPVPPNGNFVLARAVFDEGRHGFQPVQRFASDAAGVLVSAEPATGERLAGVDGGGQYWLFQTSAAEALVSGAARDSAGNTTGGLLVQRRPWTAFTDAAGRFQLLAPAGRSEVSVLDPASGDSGAGTVDVAAALTPVVTALDAAPRGPRVASLSPAHLATNVPRVTPVVVTFNRPLNPVTVVAGGVRLLDSAGAVVPASVSLNLIGTAVTLLPTSQLAAGANFRVEVAPSVADLTARPVEGDREFSFATGDDSPLRTEVPLVIHEPLNGEAALVGGPGLAEPESPVILVNETTGFTATVLSKVDGSFSNSLPADVDDLLSAVIVNRNGTRNTVPASRQLFRDGRVGLYQAGGVLTAALDGVSVAVTVPPGSVPNKTIFRLRPVSAADLAAATAGAPPAGAIPLRGFQLETTGDPLREPLRVSQPVNPAEITVLPGATPDQMAFALIRGVEIDGTPVYEVVDTARFVDGRLETEGELGGVREGLGLGEVAAAPNGRGAQRAGIRRTSFAALPFHFLFVGMANVLKAQFSVVNGKVHSVETANGETVTGSRQPVAGAAVRVGGEVVNGAVSPGSLVAISTANGSFALPGNVGLVAQNIVVGSATSQLFPGQIAVSRTTLLPDQQRLPLDLFFRRGGGALIADDRERPTISVSHAPAAPPTNQIATLRVLANDDKQMASVNVVTVSVTATDPDIAVSAADVTVTLDPDGTQSLQTIRRTYGVQSAKPLTANLLITAEDAAGRTNVVPYALTFGGPPPPPLTDTNDFTGPFVTRSTPVQESEGVLPGQIIRLQFSEPLKPDFLNNPGAAFQLSPSAGSPVAVLRDNDTVVELTWYRLAPGTAYHLTVVPILYDRNGNRFDQNPDNNSPSTTGLSADPLGLSFTTAALPPAALPGVVNGVGVAALGRQLLVLDRVSATQGAIHLFDAEDPAQPRFQFSLLTPAFPRAFTVIPQYAYKRTASGPAQTNDLVVAAGGTLGGEGQWLRVFALLPNGTFQRLVTTTLSSSPAAAVGKFQWSAPLLGYLENDADNTMVGLLNLQLAILADNQTEAERTANPAGGRPGKDVNGDGDFVDAGEELPLPDGALPRLGVVNGGLVAAHVAPDAVFRLRDFDLKFGGNFLGAILSAPPSDGRSRYMTFVAGGVPVTAQAATLELTPEAKRLFLLFGQELETLGGTISANLALVSQHAGNGTPPRVLVLDVTDPASPQVVNEIRIPAAHGIPQSIHRRDDGLLALATSTDQLLLDPRKLRLVPADFSRPHPALVGLVPGFGGGMMNFVSARDGIFARAVGGSALVTGAPTAIDLLMFAPGTLAVPGPVVSRTREDTAAQNVFFANRDWDEETGGANRTFENTDYEKGGVRLLDDDIITLELSRLPASLGSQPGVRVELRAGFVGPASAPLGFHRFLRASGEPNGFMTVDATGIVMQTILPTPAHPLGGLVSGPVRIPLECFATGEELRVTYRVFRPDGSLFGEDSVSFIPASAEIREIWSDQFPDARSNGMARGNSQTSVGETFFNNGTGTYDDGRFPFCLMGNRADDRSYVRAEFRCHPDIPAVRAALRFALVRAQGGQIVGDSTITGNVAAIVAEDGRGLLGSGPVIFAGDTRLYLDHFVVAGIDRNRDGQLSAPELGAIFGRAKLKPGGVRFTRLDSFPNLEEEHLKIVNRLTYENQMGIGLLTFLPAGASALLQLVSGAVGDDEVFLVSAVHLNAFLTGLDPAVASIERVGMRDVPDNRTDAGGEGLQNHNVGPFQSDGRHHTPLFRYGTATSLPQRLLKSKGFELAVRRNLAQDVFLQAARSRLSASGGGPATFSFVFNRNNSGQLFGSYIPSSTGNDSCVRFQDAMKVYTQVFESELASGGVTGNTFAAQQEMFSALLDAFNNCDPDEIDLALGIGGFTLDGLTVICELAPDATPYVPGSTPFKVRNIEVVSLLRDIYDWDMDINPFAALRSAGNGTLGIGGRIFSYEVPIEGAIPGLEVELK
jgi:hypothetical protein